MPDYHCLAPDLPEHGQSMAEKPFSTKDAAARITDLIRTRAHGGKAHVCLIEPQITQLRGSYPCHLWLIRLVAT